MTPQGPSPGATAPKAVLSDGARLGSIQERDRGFVAFDPAAQEIGVYWSEREAARAIFNHARRRRFAESDE